MPYLERCTLNSTDPHLTAQMYRVILDVVHLYMSSDHFLQAGAAGLGGSVGCASTGDQEVAGSTPAEVGNILSWRSIMKYFLRSFSPFC